MEGVSHVLVPRGSEEARAARVGSAAMLRPPSPSALARARLAALSTGFRSRYIDHVTLTGQLEAWAAAFLATLVGHEAAPAATTAG